MLESCNPGYGCLKCPHPDCRQSNVIVITAEERAMLHCGIETVQKKKKRGYKNA